jgi:hypothetical protein
VCVCDVEVSEMEVGVICVCQSNAINSGALSVLNNERS